MHRTLLRTKLYIPPPSPNLVPRPRLVERLNQGWRPGHKLTLVSAPAGSGKSTLISSWVAKVDRPAAWLSLDEGDNDPARFLSYLIAALQTIAADIGAELTNAIQSPQLPTELMLAELLNEIALVSFEFSLVLDDYHVIDAETVNAALAYLIEHLPEQMHLVLATREDPQLPLARYRARGQLTEVRADDLRFSLAEAAEFLNQVMGLKLSAEECAALESRTEGWIVGLELAALSMQGLQDSAAFIHSFTGSHRFVLDYLLEEVLQKQPESIQSFLLRTSILDRLCGPLCDTLLLDSAAAGQEILEYLERANLFIVPLDNERRWYRYHHLFAELLRNRLARGMAANVPELHRRASQWFAGNDFPNEGISHALAGQDWTRAAEIIERYSDQWPMRSGVETLLRWLESFPAEMLLERSTLGLSYAWALYMAGQMERAEHHLNRLLPLVQAIPSSLGEVYVIRVMIAANRHDLAAVIELARQALAQVPPEEKVPRSRILLSLGVSHDEMGGEIASARSAFREAYELGNGLAANSMVGNAPLPLTALAYLSEIEWRLGNLREASRMYEQALRLVEQSGSHSSIAHYLVEWGRANLFYERNDLIRAESALHESIRIGELWNGRPFLVNSYGLLAMVELARGQANEALLMLGQAEQIARESNLPPAILGALAIYQIAVWIAQNDFQAIALWEQGHDPDWRGQTGRASEPLSIILARATIARYYRQRDDSALGQARALIEPALERAQASGLMLNVTRLLILDALAAYAQRESAAALMSLKRALTLAEPENYVRTFLDVGDPLKALLAWGLESQSLNDPRLRAYAGTLLSQLGADSAASASRPGVEALIEPLTQRELEVLRLIAQGLSNREIGERLFLALSTVKGHTRIIFDKMHVHRRTEAVARARQLGLL